MDILVSSNLERLLFLLSGNDSGYIQKLMQSLNENGEYKIEEQLLDKIKEHFVAGFATEEECKQTIKNVFANHKRIIDTHTAVAYNVATKMSKEKSVIASTASPYKFSRDVLNCIYEGEINSLSDFECIDKLYELTKERIPENLLALKNKRVRFEDIYDYDGCKEFVNKMIKK